MCIDNTEYPVSLTLHKVYKVIPDERGEKFGDVRIIDDTGEAYLFPATLLAEVTIPKAAEASFELAIAH
jgi:hypothetical protein